MPTRREWLTGIQEFLWRPWGPIESFDTTLPYRVRQADVLTQLVTDHFHYFQHGSNGYYEDYHGFEFIRGHEDDAWMTSPYDPDDVLLRQVGYGGDAEETDESDDVSRENPASDPHNLQEIRPRWSYVRNVEALDDEEDFFAPKVYSTAADWLERNTEWDQWFLYVDGFDVHEPFHCPEPYASMYTDEDPRDPDLTVWPYYGRIDAGQSELSQRELDFVRSQFAGKVTMVDRWFGTVLDQLSALDLWDDTVVIVTSDHGHFLGEHGWMGKPTSPDYNVLTNTPLMIWHPESPRMGTRVNELTSAVDLHDTILDVLGVPIPDESHGRSLRPLLRGATDSHREWAMYGWWGSTINVTDGTYTYHHPCSAVDPVYCHSTTQMNPWGWMGPRSPKTDAESGQYLPYTDTPVWRFSAPPDPAHEEPLLFNVEEDPRQIHDLTNERPEEVDRMVSLLRQGMAHLEAPEEQYDRFDLERR